MRLTNTELIEKLTALVATERQTTAEILELLREVSARRLFIDLGFTSLFAYMTKALKYSPAAAQRRIEAARLLTEMPELKTELQSGDLNLSQVSMVAQGLRQHRQLRVDGSSPMQKSKDQTDVTESPPAVTPTARTLLNAIRSKTLIESQRTIAQALDLPIQQHETRRIQKDESVRLELTLPAADVQALTRIKELISHTHPNPTTSDLVHFLAEEFLKRKDPLRKPSKEARRIPETEAKVPHERPATTAPEVASPQTGRRLIPTSVRCQVLQRDQVCQWRHRVTGEICGSRFLAQVDHRQSYWAGGNHHPANLQLLCAVHNQTKYRIEAGLSRSAPAIR